MKASENSLYNPGNNDSFKINELIIKTCEQSDIYKLAFGKTPIQQKNQAKTLAVAIAKTLKFDNDWIKDEVKKTRVLTYYLPVALWLE